MASDDPKVVQGTEEIVFTLIFNVPPGVDAQNVMSKLAETVTVAVGMVSILRETHQQVRPRIAPKVQLL